MEAARIPERISPAKMGGKNSDVSSMKIVSDWPAVLSRSGSNARPTIPIATATNKEIKHHVTAI